MSNEKRADPFGSRVLCRMLLSAYRARAHHLATLLLVAAIGWGCSNGDGVREGHPLLDLALVDDWKPPAGAPEGTPVARHGQLAVAGSALVDQHGDPVVLKGVSSMWLNWDERGYALDKRGLEFMRDDWGMEVFRAAMGVEEAGGYLPDPERSLKMVRRIVQNAIDLGIYVVVDFHDHNAQDRPEVAEEFFAHITREFGAFPNVLYEPFNEPLKVSWTDVLKPYHERVVRSIRERDPDNVIILGTPQWSQLVDEAARAPLSGTNLMYTLHFYTCTHLQWLRDSAEEALQQGLPLFVTEWGATHADGGLDGVVCRDEAQSWLEWMAKHGISWIAWKLDGCTDASCLFRHRSVPTKGGWQSDELNGHASLVIEQLALPDDQPLPSEGSAAIPDAMAPEADGGM